MFNIGAFTDSIVASWAIPAAQVAELKAGRHYVNIHTTAFGAGEVRAQLEGPDMIFRGPMNSQQEVPPTVTIGGGTAVGFLNAARTNLRLRIEAHNLTGPVTACHVHRGAVGVSGPVVFNIGAFSGSKEIDWALAPADVADLFAGLLYVNVHTAAYGAGEIRGQLLPQVTRYSSVGAEMPSASRSGLEVVPNPMRESGFVRYTLPQDGPVRLRVVDARGRLVRELADQHAQSGKNRLEWDGRDRTGALVPSGVYYYVLTTPQGEETQRVVMVR